MRRYLELRRKEFKGLKGMAKGIRPVDLRLLLSPLSIIYNICISINSRLRGEVKRDGIVDSAYRTNGYSLLIFNLSWFRGKGDVFEWLRGY